MAGLTPKQELFCREYLVDLNATQAAIRAGYSEKTAQPQSARLLSNVMVRARVIELMNARAERVEVTADRVLRELAKMGFADIRKAIKWGADKVEFVPSDQIDDETAGAIVEISSDEETRFDLLGNKTVNVKLKVKFADKRAALVDMGRHLGMFIDKTESSGTIHVVFNVSSNGRGTDQP